METRTLEIKLGSARDLSNVNFVMKMEAYVSVNLIGDSNSDQNFKTPIDREGGNNPNWNFTIKFTIDEAAARSNRLNLTFTIRCRRNLGDKDIGEVYVPVKELLDSADDRNGGLMQHLSYQVRKPSGIPQGVLNFSFKFGDKPAAGPAKPPPPAVWPVHAYPGPAGPNSAAYGGVYPPPWYSVPPEVYPPPAKASAPPEPSAPAYSAYTPVASETGYGYQPAPAYGYSPPAYGYSPAYGNTPATARYGYYPPAAAAEKEKGKMGMGLGAGLVGGVLGGLLIGDLVSDVGFDDAGGFDF